MFAIFRFHSDILLVTLFHVPMCFISSSPAQRLDPRANLRSSGSEQTEEIGESNSFARRAGVSSEAVTIQENRLVALAVELFGPHWTLAVSIERPLED
ncbi:hypothetical protein EYF80_040155 [Liparis tanakae]|uniref:Secreted protein n=1 Tax=Liparis tanakae TaxID=230148 RepID=A0A4Z2G7Y0_9TELE|nr:hypothetical protein EYF80_040155 [Liparis tanakae]